LADAIAKIAKTGTGPPMASIAAHTAQTRTVTASVRRRMFCFRASLAPKQTGSFRPEAVVGHELRSGACLEADIPDPCCSGVQPSWPLSGLANLQSKCSTPVPLAAVLDG
jgi:hypothetical protein